MRSGHHSHPSPARPGHGRVKCTLHIMLCICICAPRIVCSLLHAAGESRETSAFPPTPLLLTGADLDSRWAGTSFSHRRFGGRWHGARSPVQPSTGPAHPRNSQNYSLGSILSCQELGFSLVPKASEGQ